MASSYDVIVLGSTTSELVLAHAVAKAGAKVLVLEQGARIGGATALDEFAPGFRAAITAAELGVVPPGVAREIGYATDAPATGIVSLAAAGAPLALTPDHAATSRALAGRSEKDGAKWEAFVRQTTRLSGFLEALYEGPPPELMNPGASEFLTLAGHGLRLRRLGKADMVELLRVLPMPLWDWLDDWFEDDALKGLVAATGLANLFQGPRSAGTGFSLLHHLVGRGGFGARRFPRSIAEHLSVSLPAKLQKLGVELRPLAPATVLVESARARGVVLAGGETIAARAVVSGADPKRALSKELSPWHLEPEVVRKVKNVKLRGVRSILLLAVDALPSFTGISAELARSTMMVAPTMEKLERAYDAAKHGGMSDEPMLEITIPSLHAPDLAPEGKHVIHVAAQYAPYRLRGTAEGWNDAARESFEGKILATLEAHAPGLRASIVGKKLFTPPDLERELGLTEGNLYGGELTLDQILFMRPVAGLSQYATPVPGYFLCGDGTHPGGGIAGASGLLAAERVVRWLRA